MLCVDINVLINALMPQSPSHSPVSTWIHDALHGTEAIAVPFEVITGFMRVSTDRRIFEVPARADEATALIDQLVMHPRVLTPADSTQRYTRTRDLVLQLGLTGKDVPDAALAALALDLGATMVTSDRGFRRFPGLKVIDPAEHSAG